MLLVEFFKQKWKQPKSKFYSSEGKIDPRFPFFPFWRKTGNVARSILAQFSCNAIQFRLDNTTILMFPVFTIQKIGYYLFNLPLQFLPTLDHDSGCVMKMYIFLCWNGRYSFKLTKVVLYP